MTDDIILKRPIISYDLQFFAKEGPGGEKTEAPTAKKLKEARDDGKVVKSMELSSAATLILLFLILKIVITSMANGLINLFGLFYNRIPDITSDGSRYMSATALMDIVNTFGLRILLICAPFFAGGFAVALIINIVQLRGIKFTTKPMKPKLSKINPANGIKRIFSKDSLFKLLMSIAKIGLIALIAYIYIVNNFNEFYTLPDMDLQTAIIYVGSFIIDMGLMISIVFLAIGVIDFIYQKRKFDEDMKMTKQEVKDEYKNTEGNPEIKGRQRQRMREASQRRMMQELPQADVIITNPTHIAVALKYDEGTGTAPVVIAKGEDYLAQRIKDVAEENSIAIVENKPLARMLYANVDIGQEIPPELYQAVAEILAAIFKGRKGVR